MERIVFGFCKNLTENSLTSLVTTCAPTLTEINLEGCTQFARAETLLTTIAARCRHLEVLNMSECGVTTLPDAMCGRLTALKELNLKVSLKLIRPQSDIVERWLRELKSRGCEVSLPEWKVDRSRRGLTAFPMDVVELVTTQPVDVLNLFDNQLTSLPEEIGLMTGLKTLWLSRN